MLLLFLKEDVFEQSNLLLILRAVVFGRIKLFKVTFEGLDPLCFFINWELVLGNFAQVETFPSFQDLKFIQVAFDKEQNFVQPKLLSKIMFSPHYQDVL